LRSLDPIRVTVGDFTEQWQVEASVEGVPQPPSRLNAVQECDQGGTFAATLMVTPKLTFYRVSDPETQLLTLTDPSCVIDLSTDPNTVAYWVVEPPPGEAGRMTIYQNPGFVPGLFPPCTPSPTEGWEPYDCVCIMHGARGYHVTLPGKIKKTPCEAPIIICPPCPGGAQSAQGLTPGRVTADGTLTPISLPEDVIGGPPHGQPDTIARGESQPAPVGPDTRLGYRVERGAFFVNGFVTVDAGPPEVRYELREVSAPWHSLEEGTVPSLVRGSGNPALTNLLRRVGIADAEQNLLFYGSLNSSPVTGVFRGVANFDAPDLGGTIEVLVDGLPRGPDEGEPIIVFEPADVLSGIMVVRGVVFADGSATFLTNSCGPASLMDNGIVRAQMTDYGTSGDEHHWGGGAPEPGDIRWYPNSAAATQIFAWEGNLRYDDGGGSATNHYITDQGRFSVVYPLCGLTESGSDGSTVFSAYSATESADFRIDASHMLAGPMLMTQLRVTNISGGTLGPVDFAWLLDADLLPDFGWGRAQWFGGQGKGYQNNFNPSSPPVTVSAFHSSRLDGANPPQWCVGNPSGWLGSCNCFGGTQVVLDCYRFLRPFDNNTGVVGDDGDEAIVTDHTVASWANGQSHTFTYTLTFGRDAGDLDGDGDVDLSDFVSFQLCYGGSNNPPAATCPAGVDADLDGDGDVDLADFLIFQQNFTGSS